MSSHLPECRVPDFERGRWVCICNQLRACEKRVLEGRPDPGISEKQAYDNHAIYQNGYEQGKHDCKQTHAIRGLKDINRIAARGYDEGQRDALAAAVQRVEALAVNPYYCEDQWYGAETHLVTSQVITAVKGDQQ